MLQNPISGEETSKIVYDIRHTFQPPSIAKELLLSEIFVVFS